MDVLLGSSPWGGAALVFGLRVVEMSLDTIRVLLVVRGRRGPAWGIGFLQALLFVLAITSVLSHLDNILTVLGYAAGFATGNVSGMLLEERLAIGHTHLRLISPARGPAIAASLRESGFAVTEMAGRGLGGTVTLLNCSVLRRQVRQVERIALDLDPQVFITAEDLRPLRRGFWRA